MSALRQLGSGLFEAKHHEDAFSVQETELATLRRVGAPEHNILGVQSNLASTHQMLGRHEEVLSTTREVYAGFKSLYGTSHSRTLITAYNLALALNKLGKYAETKSLLRGPISDAQRTLGNDHSLTLNLRSVLADTLAWHAAMHGGIEDLRTAVVMREDVYKRTRQIFGALHPMTQKRQRRLEEFRAALARGCTKVRERRDGGRSDPNP
jgi:hypothetical protein